MTTDGTVFAQVRGPYLSIHTEKTGVRRAPARRAVGQTKKYPLLEPIDPAVTSEGAIGLTGTDEPVVALPGKGEGKSVEPTLDKLSALIGAMNEKYGADLGDSDIVWVDQMWSVVKADDSMRMVAENNEYSQYVLVLEERFRDLLVDRHGKNDGLFDLYFANPDFQRMILAFMAGTYEEFRWEAAS